ncbi:hypothetical protein C7M84_016010 [Penaeus vannamei]|uniref:Uncharacterized protein n=1 Tax=Penaeus vannamei TaxID=6689 RepID=A0A423SPA2_PENVA|nr:hypothetical protein C7M84_016010 [Penaeus vannamei]
MLVLAVVLVSVAMFLGHVAGVHVLQVMFPRHQCIMFLVLLQSPFPRMQSSFVMLQSLMFHVRFHVVVVVAMFLVCSVAMFLFPVAMSSGSRLSSSCCVAIFMLQSPVAAMFLVHVPVCAVAMFLVMLQVRLHVPRHVAVAMFLVLLQSPLFLSCWQSFHAPSSMCLQSPCSSSVVGSPPVPRPVAVAMFLACWHVVRHSSSCCSRHVPCSVRPVAVAMFLVMLQAPCSLVAVAMFLRPVCSRACFVLLQVPCSLVMLQSPCSSSCCSRHVPRLVAVVMFMFPRHVQSPCSSSCCRFHVPRHVPRHVEVPCFSSLQSPCPCVLLQAMFLVMFLRPVAVRHVSSHVLVMCCSRQLFLVHVSPCSSSSSPCWSRPRSSCCSRHAGPCCKDPSRKPATKSGINTGFILQVLFRLLMKAKYA